MKKKLPAAAVASAGRAARCWLFKEEPGHYSFADLEKDGETVWEGVANPLARKHLRETAPGDRVLYYHTGKERAIVGEMRVLEKPDRDDPAVVKVAPVRGWPRPVTLEQIKADPRFAGWELVRMPRLSVMPVTSEQWKWLEDMSLSESARR